MKGVSLFSGKMDIDVVMNWIDGMENHFECEGLLEAQNIKVAKSRLRGSALTWWKYVQDERVRVGKKPTANWNAMVTKIRKNFLPKDYEIELHKRRQGLKQNDLDVTSYTEDF